ncbi:MULTISPECIES: DUF2169 domain-containing protein [unclassified Duganella]|uniref:DUF2169 family type VI secretion system accessory protein n=1 Tax=unclassified Duganella TaxID=2636909 RepID=UPI00138F9C2D|nr:MULTISPECIES: DUF2169 domain-containing protein [unclassified Duganella]
MSTPTQKGNAALIPSLPTLRLDNRTEFDALHFDTLDQNGVAFHVIVAKTGYRLVPGEAGQATLAPTDEPLPLYDQDHYYDNDLDHSVRAESDLAPYKPVCDVVVIGDACPPANAKVRQFDIGLRVQLPDTKAPLPERPRPLNPMQALAPAVFEEWQEQLAIAENTRIPGKVLVDKTLHVSGKRYLRRRPALLRALGSVLRFASLGVVKPCPWRLTPAEAATAIPLRYEAAPGGECRIERASGLSKRIPKKHRLPQDQAANYPTPPGPPEAHDSSQRNPVGQGFSRRWYLDATRTSELPAPCIEYSDAPLTAELFWQTANGGEAMSAAGLGFVGRGWLPRRQLVGKVEEKSDWGEDEFPQLPKEFDFRYWNGAPDDQQCPHLTGSEQFTLTNLGRESSVLGQADASGNRKLTFGLPQQSLFALGANEDGAVAVMPLSIDTVLIDMESEQVELTWRIAIVADGDFEEVRLMHATDPAQLTRLKEWQSGKEDPASQTNTLQPA